MYKGWKSAGCRGWPVPKRGFGYGSMITSAQVKRQDDDDDDGIVNSIDNNNTECKSEVMNTELKISPVFIMEYAYAVTVDDVAIAFCHSYSTAIILARDYRERFDRPGVEVVQVKIKIGQVFKE